MPDLAQPLLEVGAPATEHRPHDDDDGEADDHGGHQPEPAAGPDDEVAHQGHHDRGHDRYQYEVERDAAPFAIRSCIHDILLRAAPLRRRRVGT